MIVFEGVVAGYVKGRPVLRGITASLKPPCIILGPNGAGKTTLFRVILGLTPVSSGRVTIDGRDIDSLVGAVGLVSTNLREVYTLLSLPLRDIAKLYTAICNGDYEWFVNMMDELGFGRILAARLHKMSAGERRMALNLLALSIKSKYVLLDEPFENLDPRSRARLMKLLLSNSGRLIINTHATWLLERLEGWKAYIMVSGKLYGPIEASKLPRLGLVKGRSSKAELVLEVDGSYVSLVQGAGMPISNIDSLDRLYEVIAL
ncbi:MAG: ATP-binding cassette domain-containing protein [Crenarchaeota archaeon]|nr:ATP-binding cassette domain-containing protein [Thermoproteota archaeon]